MTVRALPGGRRGAGGGGEAPKGGDGLTRRERQRRETRQRLLEASLEEFRVAGFAGAQIDRIAERAGVSRGTFYFHFPTKEHVLLEQQRIGEEEIVRALRAGGPHPRDVGLFLQRVYDAILDSMGNDPGLRREILAMYVREPMTIELASEPLIVEIVDYFADATERGALRDDLPPEQLAVRFLSSLFSILVASDEELASPEGREAQRISIELFLHGAAK